MIPYYDQGGVTIYVGDCREILPQLAAGSVHCCVTSPPYFGLRRYTDQEKELGLEETPQAYVAEMAGVFEQVRRVLRQDGTAWINLGDSYASAWAVSRRNIVGNGSLENGSRAFRPNRCVDGLKEKDLIGIPWRVAFALQDAGWYLRSDIIWAKGNPMPESVTDRPTKSHEYIFLMAQAERYWYDADAIAEPVVKGAAGSTFTAGKTGINGLGRVGLGDRADATTRNKRSVWQVNTTGFPGAHFAVFPEKLIAPCILAGTPDRVCAACGAPWQRVVERTPMVIKRSGRGGEMGEYGRTAASGTMVAPASSVTLGFEPSCTCNADTIPGTVIDCFGGSGTTARVAKRLGRRAILVEQNEKYAEMAASSLAQEVLALW